MPCSRSPARVAAAGARPSAPGASATSVRAHAAVPPAGRRRGGRRAFAYRGVGRELVARVKYRNARAVVPWLAAAMVQHRARATGSRPPRSLGRPPRCSAAGRGASIRRRSSPGPSPASCGARCRALARSTGPARRRPGLPRRRAASARTSSLGAVRTFARAARRRRRHHRAPRSRPRRLHCVPRARPNVVAVTAARTPPPGIRLTHGLPILREHTHGRRRTDARCTWTSWFEARTARCRPGCRTSPARRSGRSRASPTTRAASRSTSPRCTPHASMRGSSVRSPCTSSDTS